MKEFRADMHIHTVLSPCADWEMTPGRIVDKALEKGLDIIGICDHNSGLHCRLTMEIGKEKGLLVVPGVEVNTKEEVHCLSFFESIEKLEEFMHYIDSCLIIIPHNHEKMGDQVVVDREENIIMREDRSLYSSINQSVEEIEKTVHKLGGLFIPAHINRTRNSLISQLGFVPEALMADALEIRPELPLEESVIKKGTVLITSSDAHFADDIGKRFSFFRMQDASFNEIRMALHGTGGRKVLAV